MALEEEFNTEIPDEEAERIKNGMFLFDERPSHYGFLQIGYILTFLSTVQHAIDYIKTHKG
jgi:hypothetical protein